MRSHRRRGPLEHVLVAGDLDDLTAITALLAMLPAHAYGQVYVETPADTELPALAAPARVTVTRLARPLDAERGVQLAGAVAGWVAEWVPDEPVYERLVTLWIGATACDRVAVVDAPLERL